MEIPVEKTNKCQTWKRTLGEQQPNGFDVNKHPSYLKLAIEKSEESYVEDGYFPKVGCTQVFRLGQKLYKHSKEVLEEIHENT